MVIVGDLILDVMHKFLWACAIMKKFYDRYYFWGPKTRKKVVKLLIDGVS